MDKYRLEYPYNEILCNNGNEQTNDMSNKMDESNKLKAD